MDASIPNIHIIHFTLIILLAVMLPLHAVYANNQKLELSSAANIDEQLSDTIQDPTMPKVSLINNSADLNTENSENANDTDNNSLQLSMIKIGDNERTAIINEQTVREQDLIGTYQVIKIEPNKVTLKTINKDNKELFTELRLPAVTIKQ